MGAAADCGRLPAKKWRILYNIFALCSLLLRMSDQCSHERLYIPRHRTQITLALLYRTAVRLYLYPAVLQLYHYNVTAQLQVQLYSSNPIIAHLEASSVLSDWERPHATSPSMRATRAVWKSDRPSLGAECRALRPVCCCCLHHHARRRRRRPALAHSGAEEAAPAQSRRPCAARE